jgi:hypothetical protein
MHRAERVEIPVRLLRGGDPGDEAVERAQQGRIRLQAQAEGGTFNRFVGIGVVEGISGERLLLEVGFPGDATAHGFGGEVEIFQPLGFLALPEGKRERDQAIGLLPIVPEAARDPHVGERHRAHRIIRRRKAGGRTSGKAEAKQGDGSVFHHDVGSK